MKKEHIIIIILILIWCIIEILIAVSPFAQPSVESQKFKNTDIFTDISSILIIFTLPLICYYKRLKGARIALSIIIGIFIIEAIAISLFAILTLISIFSVSLILIIVFSLFYISLSIIWYIVTFSNN